MLKHIEEFDVADTYFYVILVTVLFYFVIFDNASFDLSN